MTGKMEIMTTRFSVTLWDCGCITWIENNEFTYLPCNQDACKVLKVVKEEMLAQGKKIVRLDVEKRVIE